MPHPEWVSGALASPPTFVPVNSPSRLGAIGGIALLMAALVAVVTLGDRTSDPRASAQPIAHGSLVPASPEREHPVVIGTANDKQVLAAEQVGRAIVVGGSFTQVETTAGVVLDQPFFAAWSLDTGEMICPGLLRFDDEVLAIEPGATDTQMWVGGRFDRATGVDGKERPRNKLALVDLADCTVDRMFAATGADGKIEDIVYTSGRLFVGGDFTRIGGVNQAVLAEVDPTTAAVKTDFALTFTGGMSSSKVRGMDADPAGTRLILGGRFGTISDGVTSVANSATAIIDITATTPRLTAHAWTQPHPEWGNRPLGQSLQDVSISPDGSLIGLAFGTATISDYVYLVPAVEAPTSHRWQHYMRDSSFSIAVSDSAVYVQGHFCKIDDGPGVTDVMTKRLDFRCTPVVVAGSATDDLGVERFDLAYRVDGQWLQADGSIGADYVEFAVAATDNGFRHETSLPAGEWKVQVRAVDLAGRTSADWTVTEFTTGIAPPEAECSHVREGTTRVVTWTPIEGEDDFHQVRVDGSWVTDVAVGTNTWVDTAPVDGAEYVIRSREVGMTVDVNCVDLGGDPPPAPPGCTTSVGEDGSTVLLWDAVPGEDDSYLIRVDGIYRESVEVAADRRWIAAPGDGTTFIVRSREGGVNTDLECIR